MEADNEKPITQGDEPLPDPSSEGEDVPDTATDGELEPDVVADNLRPAMLTPEES